MLEHQISLNTEPSLFVYLGTRKIWRKKGEFKCDKANILPSFTLSTQSLPNIIVCIMYIDAFTDTQSCGVKPHQKYLFSNLCLVFNYFLFGYICIWIVFYHYCMYLSYTAGTKQKDCPHNNREVHPYKGIIKTRQRKVGQ